MAEAREYSGRHEYDGTIQDLSPAGVRKSLAALAEAAGAGAALDDAHDEAHLAAFEDRPASCSASWSCTGATR